MRASQWVAIIATGMAVPGAAAHRAGPHRSIELIRHSPVSTEIVTARSDDRKQVQAVFRVHDLRRQWVEGEMRTAFAAPAADRHVEPSAQIAATSSIPVPSWLIPTFAPRCAAARYVPSGLLRAPAEERRRAHFALMSGIACEYGVPVALFDALIIQESRYDPGALSPKLAFGLTQLLASTARQVGVDRHDVAGNLRGGAAYFRQQLDRFGQFHLALAAYNAGPDRVRDGGIPNIAETQAYVINVLANWARLTAIDRLVAVQSSATAPPARPTPPTPARTVTRSSF